MKRVFLALGLSAALSAQASPTTEQKEQFCTVIAKWAANVAVARDRGVTHDDARKVITSDDPERGAMLRKVVDEVYRSFLSPPQTYTSYYNGCAAKPRPRETNL